MILHALLYAFIVIAIILIAGGAFTFYTICLFIHRGWAHGTEV